jgi:hypothetical protein
MADLSEMEQRVLAELEEAWRQNVFSMLNTIIDTTGDAQEVTLLQQALQGLVERDYAIMALEGFTPRNPEEFGKSASLELLSRLRDWFRYDAEDPHWTLSRGDFRKERYPVIASTVAGRQKAAEILKQRGHKWWRPKK